MIHYIIILLQYQNSVGNIETSDIFNFFPSFCRKNKNANIAPTPAIIIFSLFFTLYFLNYCIYYEPGNCR